MKIVLCQVHPFALWNPPEWMPERLRKDFPGHQFVHLQTYDRIGLEIEDANIFIGTSLRPQQFVQAKELQWVHSLAAAVHQLMFPELVKSNVLITNSAEVHGPVVAEHAIALVMALSKRLPSACRYQAQHRWGQQDIFQEQPRPREFRDATLGVIGLGAIGREVARLGKALGMRVIAMREHPERGSDAADQVVGASGLSKLLGQSDYVVMAAPLTAKSKFMINAETLQEMKGDAYLVNVSRGPLIDQDALVEALRSKTIAGAALDVFDLEPIPADSPWWSLDNVLITPHIAAVTEKLWDRHYTFLSDNLKRFFAHRPLRGLVDKARGY